MADVSPHSTRNPRRLQAGISSGVLLLCSLIYFRAQLFTDRSLYWGDIGLYFVPMLDQLHRSLLAGRIPLWNPWILCGTPYVGNPQTWPLYPGAALFRFWDAPRAIGWSIALHGWLAGVGMYLFARRTAGARWAPALLAALTFMFGGQFVAKEQFPNMLQAEAYVPWLLFLTDRALTTLRRRDALLVGAALGLQLLAAHAQITLLTIYLVAIYCAWRVPSLGPWKPERVRRLATMIVMAAVAGVCLAAGQLLPTVELYQNAWRQNLTFKIVDRFYLPLNQLGNFVAPNAHGHPMTGDFTARGNFWETCCYVGVLPMFAALAAMGAGWRRDGRPSQLWTAVFLLGVWLATGKDGHLYYFAFKALPGFKNFHDPARCLLWASVALSMLAAIGFDGVLTYAGRRGWGGVRGRAWASVAVLVLAFVDLAHFGGDLYPLAPPAAMSAHGAVTALVRADPMVRARQARIMAPDSARVWQRFTSKRSYQRDLPHYGARWRETLTPNLAMELGVPDAYGYEPVTRLDAQMISGGTALAFEATASPVQRANAAMYAGAMGVRYVVTDRAQPPDSRTPGLATVLTVPTAPFTTHPEQGPGWEHLSLNTLWLPRCRLAGGIVAAKSPRAAARMLARGLNGTGPPIDLFRNTVIAGPVDPIYSRSEVTPVPDVADPDPEHVRIHVRTDGPAMLILADTLHPGWTATVDGRPAPIRSADGFLRAAPLPNAGAHHVEFAYRPASFQTGLYLTLLTIGLLTASAVYLARRRAISAPRNAGNAAIDCE